LNLKSLSLGSEQQDNVPVDMDVQGQCAGLLTVSQTNCKPFFIPDLYEGRGTCGGGFHQGSMANLVDSELAVYLRVISFGKFLEGIVVQSPAGSAVYFFAL
jgi:hypothetical protein